MKAAHKFIALLQRENAQLHGVLRLLGQLVDDMNANCSFEVFEAQWNGLTEQVKRLSGFFESHQKALQSLQDAIPSDFEARMMLVTGKRGQLGIVYPKAA